MVIPPLIGNPYNGYINPYTTGLRTIPTIGKQWEFRLTLAHMITYWDTQPPKDPLTTKNVIVLVVTVTGWGEHPKIPRILSLRS